MTTVDRLGSATCAVLLAVGAFVLAIAMPAFPARAGSMHADIPELLSEADLAIYRSAFAKLNSGQLTAARDIAATAQSSLLASVIEGEVLLGFRARSNSFEQLSVWLASFSDHPQAIDIYQRARAKRSRSAGLVEPVSTVHQPTFYGTRERTGSGPDPQGAARRLAAALRPVLRRDDAERGETIWRKAIADGNVPDWAASYWAYRIGWRAYINNDIPRALRMGAEGGFSATPDAAAALWVAGLAAWRLGDTDAALGYFAAIDDKPDVSEDLHSAGLYWAARSAFASARPERIADLLGRASAHRETFYGLMALRTLGFNPQFDWFPPGFISADWNQVRDIAAVQRAVALVQVGELGLADRELKHLWGRTDPQHYGALVRLSAALNLPATQVWLGFRPPMGQSSPPSGRYPAPNWEPFGGWRVDKALVYALALQESRFQTRARSRAGARGLMQLMPATASGVRQADHLRGQAGSLYDPEFNMELGQTYLEELAGMGHLRGALPKIIAAYNAGPGSVLNWETSVQDGGDPLLFIESIPFSETRHYVEVVLRNYWLYQLRFGAPTPSMDALIRGSWPDFPAQLPSPDVAGPAPDTSTPITTGPITTGPITTGPITTGPITTILATPVG